MTTEIRTDSTQLDAVGAAMALLSAHPELSAGCVSFRLLAVPGRLERVWGMYVAVHRSLSEFERWREVLDINPATIDADEYGGTAWLEGSGSFAGVPAELVGYYDLPDDEPDER
ncbi:hypothetical protein ACIGXM_03685 [Kitasatospora sp. NPDC052896]|uniref:hypothetical protein n=1 Tax=Kitasatospora sp. NPDC052896 TaxID=3364061 RepID=UPI0037C66CC5